MNSTQFKTEKSWVNKVHAITLFIKDKDHTRKFYEDIFALQKVFEDDNSVVFNIGDLLINFLQFTAANELVFPAKTGRAESGVNMVLTIHVKDVDMKYAELKAQGVKFLIEPTDRAWGIRTANFTDPDGYIWEIATPIDNSETL